MKAEKKLTAMAARKGKAGKLNVLVFEPEGGAPYTVDVTPDDSTFKLPGKELTFKMTRGSVWVEAGKSRTCVNADNPQTVNVHTLTGSDTFSPAILNGIVDNNLAVQVAQIAKTKPIWARGTTWGIIGMGLLMGLLMFWMIKVLGGGFEEMREAIEGIKITTGGGAGADPSSHEPIAPGRQSIAPGGI